jgi:hypothetical protein
MSGMNDAASKRRLFRLWLLLAAVAGFVLVVGWLTWELNCIHERRAARNWLNANGGAFISRRWAIEQGCEGYCPKTEIPFWRRWLGDETAGIVLVDPRATPAEKVWIARVFNETQVLEAVQNSP